MQPGGNLPNSRARLRAFAIISAQAIDRWQPILAVISALAMIAAEPARAAVEEATQIGGVDVVVWTPSTPPPARVPVLVFSHALYMLSLIHI